MRVLKLLIMVIAVIACRPTAVDGFLVPLSPLACTRFRTEGRRNHHVLYAKSKKKKKPSDNTVAVNRIAYRNYEIIDTLEAGISLLGTEVKSIRDGKLNLRDGFVRPSKNGRSCVLHNVHVGKCSQVGAEYFQHEEKRPRALLVHRAQARKFLQQTEQQGMTVIPLKAYWNDDNKLKLQIALCRGKNVRDKRATIQERDAKRETSRIIKNFRI
jgi:SsrA-binding protein